MNIRGVVVAALAPSFVGSCTLRAQTAAAPKTAAERPAPDAPSADFRHGPIHVAVDGRHFAHADGAPFLWLGDTAWELFHRLTREEAERHLEDRRRKGFTVVQAVALAEFGGLDVPNAYGRLPLVGREPTRPDTQSGPTSSYWGHVDWIIDRAATKGLVVALLPTWGEWVTPRFAQAPVFRTPAQGYAYGRFLGARYRRRPNVVWVLGGDRLPTEAPLGIAVWRAMAEGIADGVAGDTAFDGRADYSKTLMTYHAFPSSSTWFHGDAWITAHMWGTYHFRHDDPRSYEAVAVDLALPNAKPTINGEPPYEDHPVNWKAENGWFDAFDVRQAAYWSLFAGAAGYTYGAQPVWQFYAKGRTPASPTRRYWTAALDLPGTHQMTVLRRLIASRPLVGFAADSTLVLGGQSRGGAHVQAGRGAGYLFAYAPTGRPFTVHLGRVAGDTLRGWWFDPRTGAARAIGRLPNAGTRRFAPPGGERRGNDWVLVLDDARRGYPRPGTRSER